MVEIGRLAFSKIRFEIIWSSCLIKLCNGGVVKVSLLAGFKLKGHERHFSELKRLIITGCGVCFVQGLLVLVKLIFIVG